MVADNTLLTAARAIGYGNPIDKIIPFEDFTKQFQFWVHSSTQKVAGLPNKRNPNIVSGITDAFNQLYGMSLIFENDFVQFQLGLMEEELWENKKGVIRTFGGICEMQEILQEDLPKELLDLFEEGRLADGCRPALELFSKLDHYLDF